MRTPLSFSTHIRITAVLAVSLVLWTASSLRARADDVYFVMPVVQRGESEAAITREAQRVDGRLSTLGRDHLQLGAVREAIESKHSKQPIELSRKDLDNFIEESRKAGIEAANRRFAQALAHLQRARSHVEGAVEALVRDDKQRKNWDNHCLLMVDAHVQRGDRHEANRHAIECVRINPAIHVDAIAFSPDVQQAIVDARSFLSTQRTGTLTIDSFPSGCPAFLNGRSIGETRAVIRKPSLGMHSIQVEGGAAGRVYVVEVGTNDVTVRIDVLLDQALKTDGPVARLDYRSLDTTQLDTHLDELARAIGATAGLSLRRSDSGDLILRNSKSRREASLPFEATEERLARAVAEVLLPNDVSNAPLVRTQIPEESVPSAVGPEPPTTWKRHPIDRRGPLALSVAGGLALATGWSLALAAGRNDELPGPAMLLGVAGGLGMLVGNSLGWQDPAADRPSPAAWLALPLGLASVVVGAVTWFVADKCVSEESSCSFNNTNGHLFGSLLIGSGVGLASFPFGYWTNRKRLGPVVATAFDTRSAARAMHIRLNWRL